MTTWAIVPIKPLNRSKSRLAEVMSPEEREEFSRSMLEHTLEILTQCKHINGVLVVSRDPAALAIARNYDVHTVQESGSPELNAALTRAAQAITTWNATRVLILPSDLPLLRVEDVEGLLKSANGHAYPRVVIAPDRRGEGTNALVVQPPGLFEFAFGLDSSTTHIERAEEAGATVTEYHSSTLALDVDTPEDLEMYHALASAAEGAV